MNTDDIISRSSEQAVSGGKREDRGNNNSVDIGRKCYLCACVVNDSSCFGVSFAVSAVGGLLARSFLGSFLGSIGSTVVSAAAEVSADVPAAESDVLPQPAKQVAVIAKAAAHAIIFFSFISKVLSLWVCYPADNVLHFSAYVTGILIPVKLAGYSRMRKR